MQTANSPDSQLKSAELLKKYHSGAVQFSSLQFGSVQFTRWVQFDSVHLCWGDRKGGEIPIPTLLSAAVSNHPIWSGPAVTQFLSLLTVFHSHYFHFRIHEKESESVTPFRFHFPN
jgi:hypothetical protein